jgi:hypothetical protein
MSMGAEDPWDLERTLQRETSILTNRRAPCGLETSFFHHSRDACRHAWESCVHGWVPWGNNFFFFLNTLATVVSSSSRSHSKPGTQAGQSARAVHFCHTSSCRGTLTRMAASPETGLTAGRGGRALGHRSIDLWPRPAMAGRPCIQGLGVSRFDVGSGGAVGRRRIEMITASVETK